MSGWRLACARAPDFALRVALRALPPDARGAPVALVEAGQHARVRAVNAAARLEGVRPDQTATRARARCPGLCCLEWDPAAFTAAAHALAEVLQRASPLVLPADGDPPGTFLVDARGMRYLGGDAGLADRLVALAAEADFPGLRVGIADSAVAARAAAWLPDTPLGPEGPPPLLRVMTRAQGTRHERGVRRRKPDEPSDSIEEITASSVVIIPPGRDADFLGALPLTALDVDEHLRAALRGLGLKTVADLRALPAAALTARFGPEARAALERAAGLDLRRPEGALPVPLPAVALPLEHPIEDTTRLIFGLRGSLTTLAVRLVERGLSATRLALALLLDDHSEHVERLEPARPLHHPAALFELLRDRLERVQIDAPIVEVQVRVLTAVPAVPEQVHLGAGRWNPAAMQGALDRLLGRFGRAAVVQPVPVDDHRPEAAGRWAPVIEIPLSPPLTVGADALGPPPPPAPVRRALPAPVPLEARLDAGGHPIAVRWSGRWRRVEARGPERLSGAWWGDDPYAREDFRLALNEGGVLWASRDPRAGGWWLRGWFD